MFEGSIWRVSPGVLHAEMVVDLAGIDSSCGLWNQLGSPHVAVPIRRAVDGDLGTLLRRGVRWIAEVCG